ncbi:MAG: hypothetical protein ACOYIK_11035 [Coriobacteriales bacterium]
MASLIAAIVLCDVIPVVIIYMLFPQLTKFAPLQRNYHGVEVLSGLGIVWFVWLAFIWVGSVIFNACGVDQPEWMSLILSAFPLLSGTCAFGLFDDWVGDNYSKGFKGHFRELRHGVLTTGMLKLIGIGMLSLFTAISFYDPSDPLAVVRVICAGCTIALFANLMNLFDMRPLRASKVYILCVVLCLVCLILTGRMQLGALNIICMVLACIGPVIATWKFDRLELAMLGDAGANTMGALVGFIFSITLPIWLLIPLTIVLFAVNLLSERYSFSKIIEKVPVLRSIDRAFRPKKLVDLHNSDKFNTYRRERSGRNNPPEKG